MDLFPFLLIWIACFCAGRRRIDCCGRYRRRDPFWRHFLSRGRHKIFKIPNGNSKDDPE